MAKGMRVAIVSIAILARKLAIPFFTLFLLITMCVDLVLGITQGYYEFYSNLVPLKRYSVIVSSLAVAPFTSIVDTYKLEKKLKSLGIEARVKPLDMVVGLAKGKAVIVMGVNSSSWRCLYCCILSPKLARELNASEGSYVIISTPFTPSAVALRVVSVERLEGLEGFVLVPDEMAKLLRGLSPRQASLAIVECSDRACVERVVRALSPYVPTKLVERIVLAVTKLRLAKASRELSDIYMSRLGISRTTLTILDIALSLVVALGVYVFSRNVWIVARREVEVLSMLGVSSRCIALAIIAIAVTTLAIASVASIATLRLLKPTISILSYPTRLEIDEKLHLASTALILAIALTGASRGAKP